MAVLQDDENMKQSGQGAQPGQPGQPAAAGGAGGGFVGSGGGQGATTAKAAPAAPTSGPAGNFTNLQSYLQANQGQDTRMGQDVAGIVNTAGKTSSDANATWQANGLADAQAGTARLDPGFVKSVTAGTQQVDPAKLAAIGNAVHNNNFDATPFASLTSTPIPQWTAPDASYKGKTDPTSVNGYGAAQSAYSGLQGVLGQANGGAPGVSALLKSTYGRPSYTAGENTLDTALTTGSSGWQGAKDALNSQWGTAPAFQDTSDFIKGVETSGQGASTATGTEYANLINNAQATSAATQATYGDAIKAAQQKAASWTNPGVFAAPAPVAVGTTSTSAAAAPAGTTSAGGLPPGTVGKSQIPSGSPGGGVGGVAGTVANAAKGAAKDGGKYNPITGPGNAISQASGGKLDPVVNAVAAPIYVNGPFGTRIPVGVAPNVGATSPGQVNNDIATQAPSAYQGVANAIGQTAPTANNVAAASQNAGDVLSGKKKIWG